MIYKRPDLQILYALHLFEDQPISKPLNESVGMGLRTKDTNQFTDRDSGRHPLRLTDVCKQAALPRPSRSASNTLNGHKRNNTASAGWLISPGVRSSYAEDGALLFDIKNGRCYSLNAVAARVWVMIEGSPGGISLEGIVDVLETHFDVEREELERAARDCLADLQLSRLVAKKVTGGEGRSASPRPRSSPRGPYIHESGQEDRASTDTQPFVQRLRTLGSLVDRLFPQGVDYSMDWRANKLKDAIDNGPTKVSESLGHVCSQLQLSLTERQARRLFKEAAGISMKEYTRKRRLVLAAKHLQDTEEPIKVIATDAGYHTQLGFRKAFSDMFGLTPAGFRRFWHGRHVAG